LIWNASWSAGFNLQLDLFDQTSPMWEFGVANRDIVVMGASAGGIDALTAIVKDLPADLPATLFVVIHTAPQSPGYLAEILTRLGPVGARYASNGETFAKPMVYLAPPDHHLLIEAPRTVRVLRGPRENRTRPAVDPLFRSAALNFGRRVIGVVLSGGLDDGTAGLRGIKMCGGTTVIQDPDDALVASMPRSAQLNVSIDYCKPAAQLGHLIAQLTKTALVAHSNGDATMRKTLELELAMVKGLNGERVTELGEPSLFTCPECHGMLVKLRDERPLRFRCHTGHAFTADSLVAEQSDATEEAIWNSIRSLQESSMLLTHLAEHWRAIDPKVADEFLRKAKQAQARANAVRRISSEHEALSEEKIEADVQM
jgi:two-component system, chemotaxis family, protein-glutamate methylesterase/glutaminase